MSKLARQILALNSDELGGFPIYVARFAESLGLREWEAAADAFPPQEALRGWDSIVP